MLGSSSRFDGSKSGLLDAEKSEIKSNRNSGSGGGGGGQRGRHQDGGGSAVIGSIYLQGGKENNIIIFMKYLIMKSIPLIFTTN